MHIRTTIIFSLLASSALADAHAPVDRGPANFAEAEPAFAEQTRAPASDSGVNLVQETVAGGLVHPWGIAVLPDGGYLLTERAGRMRHIDAEGVLHPPIENVPEVYAVQQGGLLDVALAPDFATSRVIYFSYSKPMGGDTSVTAAARAVLSEDATTLTEVTDIFVQNPPSSSPMHYGSRVIPTEEWVFVTTGEHSIPAERVFSQDLDKTYGKIIRVSPTGEAMADNPFIGEADVVPEIWSYGHRNIQGAALRDNGTLWAIEHGPRGGDELNLITPGENYGWPVVSYGINYNGSEVGTGDFDHAERGFMEPRYYWDPVIAPGGMIFYDGDMFSDWQGDLLIGSLYPGEIVRVRLDGDTVIAEERLLPEIGRVRDVEQDADGSLLVLIDEQNGSLIRITPEG